MGGVEPDLDDTVKARPRPVATRGGADHVIRVSTALDDTVARGSVPPLADLASEDLPQLVEPPASAPRVLAAEAAPIVVDPVPAIVVAPPPPAALPPLRAALPDGSEIDLDLPVYLGRRPSAPRIHAGPAPRLVALPSPSRELSATHLELKVVGGALVASDMRSTNGTVVQLPGAAPRTLIRGESAVVTPGTRIDLGEGAVLDILSPRPAAQKAASS